MNNNELKKLMKATKFRMVDSLGWENFDFKQVENQEELRYPHCPTYESTGESYYDMRIVYWSHKESYSKLSKTGFVKMPVEDRYATFIVKYKPQNSQGVLIEKVNHVYFVRNKKEVHDWKDEIIYSDYVVIDQDINIKCDYVDEDGKDNWTKTQIGKSQHKFKIWKEDGLDDWDSWYSKFFWTITSSGL